MTTKTLRKGLNAKGIKDYYMLGMNGSFAHYGKQIQVHTCIGMEKNEYETDYYICCPTLNKDYPYDGTLTCLQAILTMIELELDQAE